MSDVTDDGFLGNRLRIRQPARGSHRAGLDALLLAAAMEDGTSGSLLDLGAGVGVAGLAVAARCPDCRVTLVEIDPAAAALARHNVAANDALVGDRVAVVEADVLGGAAERASAGLAANAATHVILNPPYHLADRGRASPSSSRALAHALPPDDLDGWMRAAASLVHPQGAVTILFRADELPRLLRAIGSRLGSLALVFVRPQAEAVATRLLLRGRPQGRAPLRVLPDLVLHAPDGGWRPEAAALLSGASLDRCWWP